MPAASRAAARDDMHDIFQTAWLADPLSSPVPVLYVKAGDSDAPLPPNPWARCYVQHQSAAQSERSIGNVGGKIRYVFNGIVWVDIYSQMKTGQVLSDSLVEIVMDAFTGVVPNPSNVKFRNVAGNDIGPEGGWYRAQVSIQFEYEQLK